MSAVGIMEFVERIDTEEQFISVISDRWHRIYRDVVEIGGMLADARQKLSYHAFMNMIDRKLPFGRTTAYAYMREWALSSQQIAVQPAEQLSDSYTVRIELDRLKPAEMDKGVAEGKLYKGVPRAEVIQFRKDMRTAHQHRPEASAGIPAPMRPAGQGAASYSEMIYVLAEWRKSLGVSQCALDDKIGWAEGLASKYEIPHTNDGRNLTFHKTDKDGNVIPGSFWEYLAGLGLGIQFVPLQP